VVFAHAAGAVAFAQARFALRVVVDLEFHPASPSDEERRKRAKGVPVRAGPGGIRAERCATG